ncbi:guanitoxin biosynthesis heme-dependent pre-guanitoxin N-hydroxylase GntA [Winogradskyella ursingii]|uniref:guanitoxin biosynthesis heme-dependent pre-guanitoxin N-hydroxylase GntA n=1 Tax=Winogradskyella ursingii TaxID=2686079 RepID=UPI00293C089E|nr:guanitoxin biosynthesis heme-dependent pre-guanitoxin N-hydroxylase GntA [Winogradskyella ursingii]
MGIRKKLKRSFSNLYMSNRKFSVKKDLHKFILKSDHPCFAAQTLAEQKTYDFDIYSKIESSFTAQQILENIENFLENYDFESDRYRTYIAVFPDEYFSSEEEFENALWQLLSFINMYDNVPWDDTVSKDLGNSNFSFSIKGKAFCIASMHPECSITARRTKYPILVFNLNWQSEQLRKHNLYRKSRNHIQEREMNLFGNVNPVSSKLLQFSSVKPQENWEGQFKNKEK